MKGSKLEKAVLHHTGSGRCVSKILFHGHLSLNCGSVSCIFSLREMLKVKDKGRWIEAACILSTLPGVYAFCISEPTCPRSLPKVPYHCRIYFFQSQVYLSSSAFANWSRRINVHLFDKCISSTAAYLQMNSCCCFLFPKVSWKKSRVFM